jgi:nucleoside phosphorylase
VTGPADDATPPAADTEPARPAAERPAAPEDAAAPERPVVEDPEPVQVDGQDVGDVARESRLLADALGIERRRPVRLRGGVDVLIVTALPQEYDAITAAFSASPLRHADGTWTHFDMRHAVIGSGSVRYGVAILKGAGAGAQQTLLGIDRAIRELGPQLVVLAGIAAAPPSSGLELCDLVVSTSIVSVTSDQRGTDKRKEIVTTVNRSLVEQLQRFVRDSWPASERVEFGGVIATPSVVKDAEHRDKLFRAHPSAIALEMEGGALAEACERNYLVGTRFAVVKSIVDFADAAKGDSVHLEACARSARFLRAFLDDLPLVPRRSEPAAAPTGDEGAAPTGTHRVPQAALEDAARTFVPPPAYAAAEAVLAEHGFVALVGRRRSGRRTAARSLLFERYGRVYEFELMLGRAAVARAHIEAGAGYVLWTDNVADTGDLVRTLRERIMDAGSGFVVCAVPGRSDATGGRTDLCVEWHPLEGDLLVEAARRHAVNGRDEQEQNRVEELLGEATVRERLLELRTTAELVDAAALLRRAVRDDWPAETVASSLGAAGRNALCERIHALDDQRVQAWLVALAVLGPAETEDLTRAAEALCRHLPGQDALSASPFGGVPRQAILNRIGATHVGSPAGNDLLAVPGVDPVTALSTLWSEFSQLRPVLLEWFADAAEISTDTALHSVVVAVAEVVRLDPEAAFQHVIFRWAGRLRARSVLLTDAVLRLALDNGADASVVFDALHDAATGEDLNAAVTAVLSLGGLVGRRSPDRAVAMLSGIVRRGVDDEGDAVRRGTAATALAVLLTSEEGAADVLALLRRDAGDLCRTSMLKRGAREERRLDEIVRILFAVDTTTAVSVPGAGLNDETVRHELAGVLRQLVEDSDGGPRVAAVLRRWAKRARANPQWADWLVELVAEIVAGATGYRVRTSVQTTLRELASSPRDRPLVERIRARISGEPWASDTSRE